MFSNRIGRAMLGAVLILAATAGTAVAAKPTRPGPIQGPIVPVAGERPLTAEELAASDVKVAAAEAYIASADAQTASLVTLGCVTPNGEIGAPTTQGCSVPQDFLSVSARDQIRSWYCGPATGQVIANYSWAMSSSANKYSQTTIAGWMKTDFNGLTNAPEMRDGLNIATSNSPREPAGWAWVITYLKDTDNDWTVGDQLHAYVRSNISNSNMPLAIPVKPHDRNGRFHLSSWARPVSSPGHWIAAYGWVGLWTGNDTSRLYYTDSSRDEGGSTGKFWDPMRHIGGMIMDHTERFVW